jgi:NAD+ diphosphatase
VTYVASQPWPFPSSLMLGFMARAVGVDVRPDGEEIEDLRWFARDALPEDVRAGQVRLPPPVSIARRLIELWYGGPLGDDARW